MTNRTTTIIDLWTVYHRFCKDQFADQPEEFPTMPVKTSMTEKESDIDYAFHKFDFDKEW